MQQYQRVTIITFSMLLCTLFAANIIAAGKAQASEKGAIKTIAQSSSKKAS